ncbi:hypothetical protein ECE50_015755 [Chitinophaga sp. Mgbs1]|uniref:Uncharacterized protein n=1 Tax=Chitinophaga solisilvae TaxID=1233460 RepID=A0A433WPP4_9BACT|nr:hypothetical protein [Chitinophaga solisilvae]
MDFYKIRFPAGYTINDIHNDNIDLHVILPDGDVYFATFFTLLNIKSLMEKDHITYFWATDMVIVADLRKETIKSAVQQFVVDECIATVLTKIGNIQSVYGSDMSYAEIETGI